MDDPYSELGVEHDATPEEITKAYRKKAKKVHPDQGGDPEEFARVKQASVILLDPEKRKRFDEDGTIDDGKPDNADALALERVANFFISSINATTNVGFGIPTLDEVDLVQGAMTYFNQQIAELRQHIARVEKQIKQFDKAIVRLKTKRANDVLKTMLTKYSRDLGRNTAHAENEIKINEACKDIVKDYRFEQQTSQADAPQQASHQIFLNPYSGRAFK